MTREHVPASEIIEKHTGSYVPEGRNYDGKRRREDDEDR